MSDYQDLWRKKMKNNGGNVSNSLLSHSKRMYTNSFKDDSSYKSAILIKSNSTEIPVDTRVINIDKTTNEKRIQVLPDNAINIGDYIAYSDKTYLVEEFESNVVVPYCKVVECNQVLRWIDKVGNIHEYPCIMENDSYGVKENLSNDYISEGMSKAKLRFQANEFTNTIPMNFRFIFNNSKNDIYKVIDISTAIVKGVIVMITAKDLPQFQDDFERNLAYNKYEVENTQYRIVGDDKIKLNINSTYVIEPNGAINYSIDDNSVAEIVSQSNGECVIRGIKINEIFTLTATLNGVMVDSKSVFISR